MATEGRAPWEVIREAADKIEAAAAVWEQENKDESVRKAEQYSAPPPPCGWYPWAEIASAVTDEHTDRAREAARAWIAALSPAVAEPLVAWLRAASQMWQLYDRPHLEWTEDDAAKRVGVADRAALVFARQILGGDHD